MQHGNNKCIAQRQGTSRIKDNSQVVFFKPIPIHKVRNSELVLSLSSSHQLCGIIARTHARTQTPTHTELVFAVLLTGKTESSCEAKKRPKEEDRTRAGAWNGEASKLRNGAGRLS